MSSPSRSIVARVSGLFIYPVKSLRGCSVTSAAVDPLGFVDDRRFLVVDKDNRFLTQRVLPRMALIGTEIRNGSLLLSAKGRENASIPLTAERDSVQLRQVSIWKSEGLDAEDCGDAVAAWLSDALEIPCRLVRIGPAFHRAIIKPAAHPGDVVSFADAYPFMGISEASLQELNRRLAASGQPDVPMDRFRPNLVFSGCPPFAEDTWREIQIADVVLRPAGPCVRCNMTTVDQQTAKTGVEPLRTLAQFRRDPTDANRLNFGQNYIHQTKTGTLRVGDEAQVL